MIDLFTNTVVISMAVVIVLLLSPWLVALAAVAFVLLFAGVCVTVAAVMDAIEWAMRRRKRR